MPAGRDAPAHARTAAAVKGQESMDSRNSVLLEMLVDAPGLLRGNLMIANGASI